MNRLVIAAAAAAAVCGVAIPAVAGLSGNPSFSQRIPVRVPSSAHPVRFDPSGAIVRSTDDSRSRASEVPSAPVARTSHPGTSGPSDDNGGTRTQEAGDDHGGARTVHPSEPGDDHGGRASSPRIPEASDNNRGAPTARANEPADDNRRTPTPRASEPGDDNGGARTSSPVDKSGGSGGDSGGDSGGHGGR